MQAERSSVSGHKSPAPQQQTSSAPRTWSRDCSSIEARDVAVKLATCQDIGSLIQGLPVTYQPHLSPLLEELHQLYIKSSNAGSVHRQLKNHKARVTLPMYLNARFKNSVSRIKLNGQLLPNLLLLLLRTCRSDSTNSRKLWINYPK